MAENLESSNDAPDNVSDENMNSEIVSSIINEAVEARLTKVTEENINSEFVSSIINEAVEACFTQYSPEETPRKEALSEEDYELFSSLINEVVEVCFTKYLSKESPGKSPGKEVTEELRHLIEPIIDETIKQVLSSDTVQKFEADKEEHRLSQAWMRNLLLQILNEKAFDTKIVLTKEQIEIREKFKTELTKVIDETIKAKLDAEYLARGGWRRLVPQKDQVHDKDYYDYITDVNTECLVEVKFLLQDGSLIRREYTLETTILDIKYDFQDELCIPYGYITINEGDEELLDDTSLADLKLIKPSECFLLCMKYKVPVDVRTITVTIESDDPEKKKIVYVEIYNSCIQKPYLGGYKHKITGLEYQHAFSQTKGRICHVPFGARLQRCTQTHYWRENQQNTRSDSATQMYRRDLYIASTTDRILHVGKYEDYETYYKRMDFVGKAIRIQKWWRGCLARKKFAAMMEKKRRDIEWAEAQIREQKEAYEQFLKSEIVKKTYPFTRADFEKLYALLNTWYSVQSNRISDLKTEAPKKADLFTLLNKELQSLSGLEKWKADARKNKIVRDRKKFLDLCSSPIKFISKCGKRVLIETLEIQRAERLRDIFLILDETNVPSRQYIKNAARVKSELTDYNKIATEELIELLNKECMLLARGVKIEDLSFLHERIERAYFELLKDPDFNPEAAKYVLAHALQNKKLSTNTCGSCRRLLINDMFTFSTISNKMQKCKCCSFSKRISTTKTGMGPYEYMRELLCINEVKQKCSTYFAFTMQIKDYHLLIAVIWHNESIISRCKDLNELRLCRWNKDQDWSPWNCILLTLDEMIVHLKLTNLKEVYDDELINKVLEKHLVAKTRFKHLLDLENNTKILGEAKKIKFGVQAKDIMIY